MPYIEGLILKKLDYKESSHILYVYTAEGLKSVLVHGSRKPKSPYLNLTRVLNQVALHVTGRDLLTLKDGDVIKDYRAIKADLERFTYALHIVELIYAFAKHDHDHSKLYGFLLKVFDRVETEEVYIPYLYMVELKLLNLLGVNPLFSHCVSCDRADQLRFSIKEGGMCCPDHYEKGAVEVADDTLKLMQELYYYDLQNPRPITTDALRIKELRLVIDRYYEYHLNFRSHSRRMLTGLIGY